MQLNIVPPLQGLQWMRQGVATFRKRPLAILGVFFIFLALVNVISLLPGIGVILSLTLLPSATLGFMAAAREVARGNYPMPTVLFTAFRGGYAKTQSMLMLGVMYAVLLASGILLTQLFDGGQFMRIYLIGESIEHAELIKLMGDGNFQLAAFFAGIVSVLVAMLFWHASPLVFWHGIAPLKSMFFSFVACLRNLRAFVLYLLAWLAISMLTALVSSLLLVAVAGPAIGSALMYMLMMAVTAMFFTSQYFSFQDCFVEARDPEIQL